MRRIEHNMVSLLNSQQGPNPNVLVNDSFGGGLGFPEIDNTLKGEVQEFKTGSYFKYQIGKLISDRVCLETHYLEVSEEEYATLEQATELSGISQALTDLIGILLPFLDVDPNTTTLTWQKYFFTVFILKPAVLQKG